MQAPMLPEGFMQLLMRAKTRILLTKKPLYGRYQSHGFGGPGITKQVSTLNRAERTASPKVNVRHQAIVKSDRNKPRHI